MSMTDPIADLLTRIRNASRANHGVCEIPSSKTKIEIVRILKDEGFIEDYEIKAGVPNDILRITLKYSQDKVRVISGIRRISRPGLRVYAKRDEVPRVLGGLGVAIISTSEGLVTDRQARSRGIGGEVVCYVW